jgi:hypothetical protein
MHGLSDALLLTLGHPHPPSSEPPAARTSPGGLACTVQVLRQLMGQQGGGAAKLAALHGKVGSSLTAGDKEELEGKFSRLLSSTQEASIVSVCCILVPFAPSQQPARGKHLFAFAPLQQHVGGKLLASPTDSYTCFLSNFKEFPMQFTCHAWVWS